MIHELEIRVPSGDVKQWQEYLDGVCQEKEDTMVTFTAKCSDSCSREGEIEIDIKVCNGDIGKNNNYIDAVMFQDGSEVGLLDVRDKLEGEYLFSMFLKHDYRVTIVSGTPDECPKCGREGGWYARIQNRGDCVVDQQGHWVKDMNVDDTEIYGPYQCQECGAEFEERPEKLNKEN